MSSKLKDKQLDKEIDVLFQEAVKPYDFIEMYEMIKSKGLEDKFPNRDVVGLTALRFGKYLEMRAKNDQRISNS
jgi:hypothetical protein